MINYLHSFIPQKNTRRNEWDPSNATYTWPVWVKYVCGLGRRFEFAADDTRYEMNFHCRPKASALT